MAKMATMAIKKKKKKKKMFSRTRGPMILKLGEKHQAMELYKVYITLDDLDLFYGKVNIGRPCI